MKKTDSWCTPIMSKNGNIVSGGAARNVRISEMEVWTKFLFNFLNKLMQKFMKTIALNSTWFRMDEWMTGTLFLKILPPLFIGGFFMSE